MKFSKCFPDLSCFSAKSRNFQKLEISIFFLQMKNIICDQTFII